MTPELSIALVLHNSSATLAGCVRSVRVAVDAGWAEIIAVDNDSPDDSSLILRRELRDVRVLTFDHNRGFAAGANAALACARGRYSLLLNPDVRVPPGGLEALVSWMDRHPRHGLASPEIVDACGYSECPGRATPSIARTLLELTRLHRALPRRTRGRLLRGPYWTGGDDVDAGWVPGTAMIVRPSAVRDVGNLREDLFIYGEDLEWCWRMRRAGWRVGVCSTATFVHDTSSSARATFGARETQLRIASGTDAAQRVIYGPRKARWLAEATALSLYAEAATPWRDTAGRLHARDAAKIWRDLARAGTGC